MSSPVTADASGAPCAAKSGISSASARGSSTAPETECAPISAAFSMTAMATSPSGAPGPRPAATASSCAAMRRCR